MPPGNVIETNGANHYYIISTGSLPYGTELIDYECQIDTIPEIRTDSTAAVAYERHIDTVPEIRIEDVVGRTYIIRGGRIEVQESPDDRELTAASEEDLQEFLFGEKE